MNSDILAALQAAGATSGTLSEAWIQAVQAQGVSSGKLEQFLREQGYTGSLNDNMFKYLGDKGYTGSLADRLYAAALAMDLFGTFDPSTLFSAAVYGDYMRVQDSTPQASAGLLTRWPGLRSAGDQYARFDLMPFASAPSVGAYGPSGEACVRMTPGTYGVQSQDRGGAAALSLDFPFSNDTHALDGLFVIAHIKSAAAASQDFHFHAVDTGPRASDLSLYFNDLRWYPQGNFIHGSANFAGNTSWVTVGVRHHKNGDTMLYMGDGSTPVSTSSAAPDGSIYRWFLQAASQTFDLAGYAKGHFELSDADFASLFNWVAGQ